MKIDLQAMKDANAKHWAGVMIRPGYAAEALKVAGRLSAPGALTRYQTVSNLTGVPPYIIAVIHEREASQNWDTQLGQGDPLNRVSTHEPKGMGPYPTWEAGAVAALQQKGKLYTGWKDWSQEGQLTYLEVYNGIGYYEMGKPSPYVWSGTNVYTSGKYVADGRYDDSVVDKQLGCVPMLLMMVSLSHGQNTQAATLSPTVTVPPVKPTPEPISKVSQPLPSVAPSLFSVLINILRKIP